MVDTQYPSLLGDALTPRHVSPLVISTHSGTDDRFRAEFETKARRLYEALDTLESGSSFQFKPSYTGGSAWDGPLPSKHGKGAVSKVALRWHRVGHLLGADPHLSKASSVVDQREALYITIDYEKANYFAVLLPALSAAATALSESSANHTTFNLPLMLMRMPKPLQRVVITFLEQNFDCHVSALNIRSHTMMEIWEGWIRAAPVPAAKDVVIRFAFGLEKEGDASRRAPGLASLDVSIDARDINLFVSNAAGLQDTLGRHDRLPITETISIDTPAPTLESRQKFFAALARHLQEHVAINIFHPDVHVTRFSCAAFVLSERSVKLTQPGSGSVPPPGVWGLIGILAERSSNDEAHERLDLTKIPMASGGVTLGL
jgi:hypothetical protein